MIPQETRDWIARESSRAKSCFSRSTFTTPFDNHNVEILLDHNDDGSWYIATNNEWIEDEHKFLFDVVDTHTMLRQISDEIRDYE